METQTIKQSVINQVLNKREEEISKSPNKDIAVVICSNETLANLKVFPEVQDHNPESENNRMCFLKRSIVQISNPHDDKEQSPDCTYYIAMTVHEEDKECIFFVKKESENNFKKVPNDQPITDIFLNEYSEIDLINHEIHLDSSQLLLLNRGTYDSLKQNVKGFSEVVTQNFCSTQAETADGGDTHSDCILKTLFDLYAKQEGSNRLHYKMAPSITYLDSNKKDMVILISFTVMLSLLFVFSCISLISISIATMINAIGGNKIVFVFLFIKTIEVTQTTYTAIMSISAILTCILLYFLENTCRKLSKKLLKE